MGLSCELRGYFVHGRLSRSPILSPNRSMEAPNANLDLLRLAIRRIIDEKRMKKKLREDGPDDDDEDEEEEEGILLSKLLSKLESLKGDDGTSWQMEPSMGSKGTPSADCERDTKKERASESDAEHAEIGAEDVVKELNKVKRQNSLTHWLLSIMIFLTLAWQVSEVSLVWKVKNGLNHPFRSVGSMLSGMLRGRSPNGEDAKDQLSSAVQHAVEAHSLPPLEIPELPHLDLQALGWDGEDD